jgi:hypothetical protein
MTARLVSAVLGTIVLAIGATACGGDESSSLSDESAAAVEEINAACDKWKLELDERGDFPVDDFDPENPSPDDLPAVGDYFDAGIEANEEAIATIDQLVVPSEIEADVDALVEALQTALANTKTQITAAQAGDVEAFKATLATAGSTQEDVKGVADELGATSCSF